MPWASANPTADARDAHHSARSAYHRLAFLCVPIATAPGCAPRATATSASSAAPTTAASLLPPSAVLLSTCHDVCELHALASNPLLRCLYSSGPSDGLLAPSGQPKPCLGLVLHAVSSALRRDDGYQRWSRGMTTARHAILNADALPRREIAMAFVTAAVQRATLRHVVGTSLFPTPSSLTADDAMADEADGASMVFHGLPSSSRRIPDEAAGALSGASLPASAAPAALEAGAPSKTVDQGCGHAETIDGLPLMSWDLDWRGATLDTSRCAVAPDDATIAAEVRAVLAAAKEALGAHDGAMAMDVSEGDYDGGATASKAIQTEVVGAPRNGSGSALDSAGHEGVRCSGSWPRDRLLVCMLGTGCAVPSKHRAPSAIYLHAYERGGVLLDCGEGTLGQMHALLGPQRTAAALRGLGAIFISHHHADHHLGVARLLVAVEAARNQAADEAGGFDPDAPLPRGAPPPSSLPRDAPLLVVGPRVLGTCLASCFALLPPALRPRYQFESCGAFNSPRSLGRDHLLRRTGLGLAAAQCVPVVHCADAWGVVLTHTDGWRVVYSGDTRPCDALVAAGQGATLLIHEATFDDDLSDDAKAKRHSTRSEALGIARRMRAHRTILTHLSQRYHRELAPTRGPSTQSATAAEASGSTASPRQEIGSSSLVAFDMMAINLADLDSMPLHMPHLQHYFACEQRATEAQREAQLAEQMARSERIEREIEAERQARSASVG